MELDGLYEPTQAPSRPSRFAPKGSKLKPKAEPGVTSSPSVSSIDLIKKEELDAKPELLTESTNPFDSEDGLQPSASAAEPVAMDVDAKPEERGHLEDRPMELGNGDDDEVVREIDVYFNPSIDPNTKLYVLQYPLRPLWRPYELDDRCREVRVRPESGEMEVDLAIDASTNYDPGSKVFMTQQTLASSWKPPIAAGYAVGVLVGDKLHLNPIHAVLQLRPSMRHCKTDSSKRSSNVQDNPEVEELKDEKHSGPVKKQSKSSGAVMDQNKHTGENWIPLVYHGARSDISAKYNMKMIEQDESPSQFSMSRHTYLNVLCPGSSNEIKRPRGLSRRDLRLLPLEERFRTWLLEEPQIHRFDALKHLAPESSVDNILEILRKHALLVQGLWVPKSPLLYGEDVGDKVLARDFVLLLFSNSPVIKNSQLQVVPRLNKPVKDVLRVLAFERASLGDWKFKVSPDMAFVKLKPEIVAEQRQTWESMEKIITRHAFEAKNMSSKKTSVRSPATNDAAKSKSSVKHSSKFSNEEQPFRRPMSEETREALPKALQKVFQIDKVCSFKRICECLRQLAVSENSRPKGLAKEFKAAADSVDASQEELKSIIDQVAYNIHGVYVPKSSPDYPQYDQFRKVVIDLFIAEPANAKLKRDYMMQAGQLHLNRAINATEYQKVVQELCVSKNQAWVLKSGDGSPH